MAINKFLLGLFVLSAFFLFYDIKSVKNNIKKEEKPLVSFYDTISYKIDDKNVKSIVKANEIYLYKKREEMATTTMLLRDNSGQGSNFAKSDFVTKIDNDLYLDGNVLLQAQNGIELTSEQLEYNTKTQIAKNQLPFKIVYGDNTFKGKNLFFDLNNKRINGKEINFSLKDTNE